MSAQPSTPALPLWVHEERLRWGSPLFHFGIPLVALGPVGGPDRLSLPQPLDRRGAACQARIRSCSGRRGVAGPAAPWPTRRII